MTFVPVDPTIYQDSEYGIGEYDTAGSLRAGRIPEHQMIVTPPQLASSSAMQDVASTVTTGTGQRLDPDTESLVVT